MEQYNVTGMSCAACSARVEKAVSKVNGVTSCSVNLLTGAMLVDGTATETDIIAAVEAAGYGAAKKGAGKSANVNNTGENDDEPLKDKESGILIKRLGFSLFFLLILMYFSMGHMMWNWPVPAFFAENHIAMGILQLLLTVTVMIINQKFFISGFRGLIHKAPNMDTLVSLGASASFIYSTYALFAMTDAQLKGDMSGVMSYMHEFYFESAAMILTLITLGKLLEARSKGRTTDALKGLMRLAPKTARIIKDGKETEVSVSQVKKGDIFTVRPGENIPVDGIVIDGNSSVDEAALTGESIPIDKAPGDLVSAATTNHSGFLKCEASRVGEDTTLSQIIRMVSDAAATKAPIAKIADKVSGIFVPTVMIIAAITLIIWLLIGKGIGFALARSISVLVISCPCALGLATPVAIMVGSGMGAKHGILFKTAASLEETGKTGIVVLDKTGTITKGEPKVTDIIPVERITENELLRLANTLEIKSEHPLAKAITQLALENQVGTFEAEDFESVTGSGLYAKVDGNVVRGGNAEYIGRYVTLSKNVLNHAERLSTEGKTPLFFSQNDLLMGIIAVADVIKDDSKQAIKDLKEMGIRVVMLTGDNERTANAIAAQVGIDEVVANVRPDGKESVIRKFKEQNKTAMVGDGINDAPALTRADTGIAIGAGADIAIDAADVVLMKSSLRDVAAAIRLSRATLRNIRENLFWAFIYNIIGIPLAAGAWYFLLGWKLNPMFGAAAMSLSSFSVVMNALRLNLFKPYNNTNTKIKNRKVKKIMKKTMKIEGMMCGHCSGRVKKCLEELDGVESAVVSHETGTAEVTLKSDVSDEVLKATVEAQGYNVTEIK